MKRGSRYTENVHKKSIREKLLDFFRFFFLSAFLPLHFLPLQPVLGMCDRRASCAFAVILKIRLRRQCLNFQVKLWILEVLCVAATFAIGARVGQNPLERIRYFES